MPGYYPPVPRSSAEEREQAMAAWGQAVEQMRASAGMGEDEYADLFDLVRPSPRDLKVQDSAGTVPGRCRVWTVAAESSP